MKKIIDAGALRSSNLKDYLISSKSNFAIINDYAGMEAFKGDAFANVRYSLKILSEFPNQVIILKSTKEISGLRVKKKGLLSRMTDENQTKGFNEYCQALFKNSVGKRRIAEDIENKARKSAEHFAKLLVDAEKIRSGIDEIAKSYHGEDLKDLRTGKPISSRLAKRILRDILTITMLHYRDVIGWDVLPDEKNVIYSFPFRYALCSYSLNLKWISEGGYQSVQQHKLRNDFTDMIYAAYATFYDGIITEDKKLEEMYQLSRWMLNNVFTE